MEKYISEILEQNGIDFIEEIRSAKLQNARSDLAMGRSKGIRYAVKIFASSDINARDRFIHELKVIKKVRSKLTGKYKNSIPQVIWYSTKGENPYYIYKYIDGDPIGRFVNDYGIEWGIFNHNNFPELINLIHQVSMVDIDIESEKRWGARYSGKELQFYLENDKGLLPSSIYDEVQSFYEKYHKKVFNRMVLSHRDLYPENIIKLKSTNKKFVILDWEYFGFVPIGFDAAILYLLFWKEEFWKAKVFAHYYNYYEKLDNKYVLNQFILSFRFCLAILSIRFLHQLHLYGKESNPHYSNAKASFLFDLTRALDGDIVKPRNVKYFVNINDIEKVAKRYGIGKVKNFHIYYASKGNTVAKVLSDQGEFIFRFYSASRSKTLIKRELKIFETLREAGIDTYTVIRSLKNELFVVQPLYGKDRNIAVFTFVKGKKIHTRWLNGKSLTNVAKTLRKIHDCNIIHGDYSKENVLFNRTEVSGVIDFEWGRITKSRRAKDGDLAKAIALWLIDSRGKPLSENDVITIIIGYYGKMVRDEKLKYLANLILDKINMERDIYITTVDGRHSKNSGKRFSNAAERVMKIIPSGTD